MTMYRINVFFELTSSTMTSLILLYMGVAVSDAQTFCQDLTCTAKAYEVLKKVDLSVEPCDDMYRFSCGAWQDYINQTSDVTEASVNSVMSEEMDLKLKRLIQEEGFYFRGKNSSAIKKLKDLYKTCMDEDRIERHGVGSLLKQFNKLGSWTVVTDDRVNTWDDICWSPSETLQKLLNFMGSAVLTIEIRPYMGNKLVKILHLFQDESSLTGPHSIDDPGTLDRFLTYGVQLAQIMGGNPAISRSKLREIFDFEVEVIKIWQRVSFPSEISIDNFQEIMGNWIDVETFLHQLMRGTEFKKSDKIVLESLEYFQKIGHLIRRTRPEVFANYMMWKLLYSIIPYLPKSFNLAKTEFDGLPSSGSRDDFCLKSVKGTLPLALSALYVDRYFTASKKTEVSSMLEAIRKQFIDRLDTLTWLNGQNKTNVKEKVEDMSINVGYPDWILDPEKLDEFYQELEIDEDDFTNNYFHTSYFTAGQYIKSYVQPLDKNTWAFPPIQVEGENNRDYNFVTIPAGLIRSPLYDSTLPLAFKYGSIGSFGAHELIHGFDTIGIHIDKYGGNNVILSNHSYHQLTQTFQCLIDQYNSYTVGDAKLDGQRTLDENFADNGGLHLAFKAYKQATTGNLVETGIPGLNLTNDQLFFLGYSQLWCTYSKAEAEMGKLEHDHHTHPRYRVIGALSNSRDFAVAFQCRPNTTMNPDIKCQVW